MVSNKNDHIIFYMFYSFEKLTEMRALPLGLFLQPLLVILL